MDTSDDPREKKMWMKEVKVTPKEMVTYASSYPPMGVCIPKGRIKVPHRRSKISPQTRHVTKRRSQHLLMIKQSKSSLPPIDVYRNGDLTNVPSPSCEVATASQSYKNESWTVQSQRVTTSQFIPKCRDAINMIQLPESMYSSNESTPVLPPPYVETPSANHNPFHQDFNTIMPSERTYPTNQQYYQHLSAIAAMAWSDCNQATLKLKRIYEETTQLSRAMEPLPAFQPPAYSGLPTNECATNVPAVSNHTSHRPTIVARRHLGDIPKRYYDHTVSQSGVVTCQRQVPSSFVEHCQRPIKIPMYCDVAATNNAINQNAYVTRTVGEKRKLCEAPQFLPSKLPRLAQPVPAYKVPYHDVTMPHFFNNNASFIPKQNFDSLPPSYDSIKSNYNLFPGIFSSKQQSSTSNFHVMPTNVGGDVMGPSSHFSDVLSLPSVSFSPTQPRVARPFVV